MELFWDKGGNGWGGCPHVLMKVICVNGLVMFAHSWNYLGCELKCVFRIISVGLELSCCTVTCGACRIVVDERVEETED